MPKLRKIGRVTFRELTNGEALREYGSSFVFVGSAKPTNEVRELLKEADAALKQLHEMHKSKLKTNAKKSNRDPK